jgi:hypothetical protein
MISSFSGKNIARYDEHNILSAHSDEQRLACLLSILFMNDVLPVQVRIAIPSHPPVCTEPDVAVLPGISLSCSSTNSIATEFQQFPELIQADIPPD